MRTIVVVAVKTVAGGVIQDVIRSVSEIAQICVLTHARIHAQHILCPMYLL